MADRRSPSPEVVVAVSKADALASRRTSDGKPRREPYRPSGTASLSPANPTHVDVAAPVGTAALKATTDTTPPPPTTSNTTELAHGKNDVARTRASAAATTMAAATQPRPAHSRGNSIPGTPPRSSLPEALIQEIRGTPFHLGSSRSAGVPQQQQQQLHRHALSSQIAATASSEDDGGAERQQPPHRRTVSCSDDATSSAVPLIAAVIAPQRVDEEAALQTEYPLKSSADVSHRKPVCIHGSVLSINSVNEASLLGLPCAPSLRDIFSPLTSGAARPSCGTTALRAAVAHILQRETVRQLLSRCVLKWSLRCRTRRRHEETGAVVHSLQDDAVNGATSAEKRQEGRHPIGTVGATHMRHARRSPVPSPSQCVNGGGLSVPLTSPLPPWKPITGGGVHSGSSAEDGEMDNVEGAEEEEEDQPDHGGLSNADDEEHPPKTTAESLTPRAATRASPQQAPTPQVRSANSLQRLSSASTSKGTTNGESLGDASQSGSSGQQPQQPLPVQYTTSRSAVCADMDGGLSHPHLHPQQRDPSCAADVSSSSTTSLRRSPQPAVSPLRMSALPPMTAAQRSVHLGVGSTATVSPSICSPVGQGSTSSNHNNSTGATSANATTPRQQAGEARRKSVVSQYLATKPLGNLSPQQSSTNLFSGPNGAATHGVVEVHALALPGAIASSPATTTASTHARSQSGVGGSLPRRRSDGLWVSGTTTAAAAAYSDSEEQSSSSLYFTPRSRQSNGIGVIGLSLDDDPCLSNSSISMATAAAAGGAGGGMLSPIQSIPQLITREAEDRGILQNSEQRRRARMQRAMASRMDQLMMMALHHRSSERGLHPSLRASAVPSPMATSRGSSESGDAGEDDSVNRSCSVSEYLLGQDGKPGGRRSAQRSPGRTSTRSSVSTGASAFARAPQDIVQQQQQQLQQLTASMAHRTRPQLSPTASAAASSVRRRLSHTNRGHNVEEDEAESLSDSSGDDDTGGAAAGDVDGSSSRVADSARRPRHRKRHPLADETGRRQRVDDEVDDDDDADTATAQSEATVHGLAITRQWVSQQTPEAAAAAMAAVSEASSLETSTASLSFSQPPMLGSSAASHTRNA